MAGGRPRSPFPYVTWKLHIDAALAAEVEMLLWDPVMKKPKYGDRKELIESLLRPWVAAQKGQPSSSTMPPSTGVLSNG